jgi:hypothetical protein
MPNSIVQFIVLMGEWVKGVKLVEVLVRLLSIVVMTVLIPTCTFGHKNTEKQSWFLFFRTSPLSNFTGGGAKTATPP